MKLKKVIETALAIEIFFGLMFSFLMMNFIALETSAAEPIVLSMAPSSAGPPPSKGVTLTTSNQMKLLEERTSGRIKIEIFWGQSLVDAKNVVKAASTGICDIAIASPQYEPSKLPLSLVGQMPGVGIHMLNRANAYWDLMNQEPLLSEFTQYALRPLTLVLITEQVLISRDPLRTVADIKGKKLSATGIMGDTIALLGAVPIAMSPGEQYDGLKKGIIDGSGAPYGAINDFKFYEAAKYVTNFHFGSRIMPTVIREEAWKKLPSDIQKIIIDSALDLIKIAYDDYLLTDGLALEIMKKENVEIIEPSDADKAELKKVQAGQADKWAADLEGKGLPGKKILADYRSLVEKYEKINPYK